MFKGIFKNLLRNARAVVTGRAFIWHAVAIALTFIIVLSSVDWWFYEATRSSFFRPIVWLEGVGGFFLPVLVPFGMYITAKATRDNSLKQKAFAVAQAVILASLLAIIYKAFTGRIEPPFINITDAIDNSRGFQFGFLEYGIFWGWPSSHTAVAVAGGVTLLRLVKNIPVRLLTVLYMVVVAVGAAIGFHWFSDVVAGAIFGLLIGNIIASGFSQAKAR